MNYQYQPYVRMTPEKERNGFLNKLAIAGGLATGVAGAAAVLRPVIGGEVVRDVVRSRFARRLRARGQVASARAAARNAAVDASIEGDKMRRAGQQAAKQQAKRAAADERRRRRDWYKDRKSQFSPDERKRARETFNLARRVSLKEFRVAGSVSDDELNSRWETAKMGLAAGLAGGLIVGNRMGAKSTFGRMKRRWQSGVRRANRRARWARAEAASARAEAARARASASWGGSSSSGGSWGSWGGSGSSSSGSRAGASANPHAGTPRADAWEKWQAMNRMAGESSHAGERAAASAAAAKWKQKHNLAFPGFGVKRFAMQEITVVRQKRDNWNRARDAAVAAAGLGVLGAAGYGVYRGHGLFKTADKAIRKEMPGVAQRFKATMRAVHRAAQWVGRTAGTVNDQVPNIAKSVEGVRESIDSGPLGFRFGKKKNLGRRVESRKEFSGAVSYDPYQQNSVSQRRGVSPGLAAAGVLGGLGLGVGLASLPAARRIERLAKKRVRQAAGAVTDAAQQARRTGENVQHSTSAYADLGRIYKWGKGHLAGGLYNIVHPVQTWRETKAAFRAGYHGQPAPKVKRPDWAKGLSRRVSGIKEFVQMDEAGIPFTGKVAKDRLIKKIRDEDLQRRDANILRAGIAGGLAGAMVPWGRRGAIKRALIGAGIGGAGVLGVRGITASGRDPYGERSRGGKRAELIPAGVGLGAAGYFAGKRLRLFAAEAEEKKMNPYLGAALSGATSGAGISAVPLLRRGTRFLPYRVRRGKGILGAARKAGWKPGVLGGMLLGAGASAGIVGGGALLGSRILGAPRENEGAAFTKRAAIGGGIAGATTGLAGGLLLSKTRAGRGWMAANRAWRPVWAARRGGALAAGAIGAIGGGVIGSLQGADEGQQVDSIRNLRKDLKKFSRGVGGGEKFFGYYNQPREDWSYTTASGEVKKSRKHGRFTDPFWDAAGLGAPKLMRNPDGSQATISQAQYLRSFYRRGKDVGLWGGRAGGLVSDMGAVLSGQPRRRDVSGRPVKREWEKSWFQKAAGAAASGAALAGGALIVSRTPWGRKVIQPRLRGLRKKAEDFGVHLSRRGAVKHFDAWAEANGWDVRDPRGKSVRVFSPGAKRRIRREAEWHETKDGQRRIWQAVAGVGAAGALAGGLLIGRRIWKSQPVLAPKAWQRPGYRSKKVEVLSRRAFRKAGEKSVA